LRITVADNGTGIKRSDRERLFQPFFTTKKDVGTGLGLWVCKEIVDRYEGRITLRSNATPGRSWTAISVFLPVLSADRDVFQEVA
jgi:signal transduction histidine kinase